MNIHDFIEGFSEAIEIENTDTINPDTEFRQLEEWSSISIMLLIAFFDETFDKEIGGSDIKGCTTIMDLYNLATK